MNNSDHKILALKYRPKNFKELIGQDIMVQTIINSIKFIINHPLVKNNKLKAIFRYVFFNLVYRPFEIPKNIPFAGDTLLKIQTGLGVANYYTYLADYKEMLFLIHYLSSEDIFIDIGANIGAYSIISGGIIGAKTISIEPVSENVQFLEENIQLNNISNSVTVYQIALGKEEKDGYIRKKRGALNQIIYNNGSNDNQRVDIIPLDDKIEYSNVMKIDVEGYEVEVLLGANQNLLNKELNVIIIEINGLTLNYGNKPDQLHNILIDYHFKPILYDPFNRTFEILSNYNELGHNTIYVRDLNLVKKRIANSIKCLVGGKWI